MCPSLLQIHHDVYAREEHKWDYDTLTGGPRQERFPATIHIPEGASVQPDTASSYAEVPLCSRIESKAEGWLSLSGLQRHTT